MAKFPVSLFYDVISPYSWLAFESLCRYRSLWPKMELNLKPCSLPIIFRSSGNKPPVLNSQKASYAMKDLHRSAILFEVPLRIPDNFLQIAFKPETSTSMNFVTAIDTLSEGKSTEIISRKLYEAVFSNNPGKDISNPKIWLEAGKAAQIDGKLLEEALTLSKDAQIQNKLTERTKEALTNGAFGLPTMVINSPDGSHMLFGSDRIELLAFLIGEKYSGPRPASP